MKAFIVGATAIALGATATTAALAQTAPVPATATAQEVRPGAFFVFFENARFNLRPDAQRVIAEAAAELKRSGAARVALVGHTDTTGSPQYNQRLSERRAEAVRAGLVRLGVPASVISVDAVGQNDLLVPTADNTREPRNRAVRITFPVATPAPASAPVAAAGPAEPYRPLRWALTAGAFLGYNLHDQEDDKTSWLPGAEIGVEYLLTPNLVASVNYAGWYEIHAQDEGYRGRGVVGLDLQGNFAGARPYIGLNAGWIYGEGIDNSPVVGPEVGARFDLNPRTFLYGKVAYDWLTGNSWNDGVVNGGLGVGFRF